MKKKMFLPYFIRFVCALSKQQQLIISISCTKDRPCTDCWFGQHRTTSTRDCSSWGSTELHSNEFTGNKACYSLRKGMLKYLICCDETGLLQQSKWHLWVSLQWPILHCKFLWLLTIVLKSYSQTMLPKYSDSQFQCLFLLNSLCVP